MKTRLPLFFTLFLSLSSFISFANTHTITNIGFSFSPDTLFIVVGDTVTWNIGSTHNAVEVNQSTWQSNQNTPLPGGFSVGFGGGTVIFNTQSPGIYYYVCQPHASSGMKAVIIVSSSSSDIQINNVSQQTLCSSESFQVDFSSAATFYQGNAFILQISDASGNFINATNLDTLFSTSVPNTISTSLPFSILPPASGYRLRIVSNVPSITGSATTNTFTVGNTNSASIIQFVCPNTPAIDYVDTTVIANGCDSLTFVDVQQKQFNFDTTTTVNGFLIIDQQTGNTYQWIDCATGNIIIGATGNLYQPSQPGSYAAIVTDTSVGCSDTSACFSNHNLLIDSVSKQTLCETESFQVDFSSSATFMSGNQFVLQISDPTGNFANPTNLGTLISSTTPNTFIAILPTSTLAPASGYRLRIVSSQPAIIGSASTNTFNVVPPDTTSIIQYVCPNTPAIDYVDTTVVANGCDSLTFVDVQQKQFNYDTASTANGFVIIDQQTGNTYQWIDCTTGNPISGATGDTYQPTQPGSYAAIITDSLGCSDTSECFTNFVNILEQQLAGHISIFPNPADNIVNMQIDENFAIELYTLYSVEGKLVRTVKTGNKAHIKIPVSQLVPGTYLLKIKIKGHTQTVHKIVQIQ